MNALSKGSHLFQTHPLQVYGSFPLFMRSDILTRSACWNVPAVCDIQGLATSWEPHAKVLGHASHIETFAFSPCGRLIATLVAGGNIHIWNAGSGVPKRTLDATKIARSARQWRWWMQFSPSGDIIVVVSDVGKVGLWDVRSEVNDVILMEGSPWFEPSELVFINDDCFTVVFQNSMACTWSVDYRSHNEPNVFQPVVSIMDAELHPLITIFTIWGEKPRMKLSPDGRLLATSIESDDWAVHIWDVATERRLYTVHDPAGEHLLDARPSLCFSPDGTVLATRADTLVWAEVDTIWLWNTSTGEIKWVLHLDGRATEPVFSPDGQTLAAANNHGTVRLWNTHTGEGRVLLDIGGMTGPCRPSIAWSPDGRWVAAELGSAAFLCDVESGAATIYSKLLKVTDRGMVFSPDGQTLASAHHEDLYVFDIDKALRSAKRESLREPHSGPVKALACSSDGQTVASVDERDKFIVIRDAEHWQIRKRITLQSDTVQMVALAFSPDAKLITATSKTGNPDTHRFQIWRTDTGEELQNVVNDEFTQVMGVHVSSKGHVTALVSFWDDNDRVFWLWGFAASTESVSRIPLELPRGLGEYVAADFSPSGRVVAITWYRDESEARECHLFHAGTGDYLQVGPNFPNFQDTEEPKFDRQCGLRLGTGQGFWTIPRDSPAGVILAAHDCLC